MHSVHQIPHQEIETLQQSITAGVRVSAHAAPCGAATATTLYRAAPAMLRRLGAPPLHPLILSARPPKPTSLERYSDETMLRIATLLLFLQLQLSNRPTGTPYGRLRASRPGRVRRQQKNCVTHTKASSYHKEQGQDTNKSGVVNTTFVCGYSERRSRGGQ